MEYIGDVYFAEKLTGGGYYGFNNMADYNCDTDRG